MWITFARPARFTLSTRLQESVKPVVMSTVNGMPGYAQNMWISLWETLSDPRGDGLWSALLGDLAHPVGLTR
jgi:hypothetical protein